MLLFVLALSAAVLVLDERRAVMNLAIGKTWLRVQWKTGSTPSRVAGC